jgi:peptide/nickel transport system substrate-binding protein
VSAFEPVNDKTFKIILKEPYGLLIDSLAKPGGSTPLMMPKRIADTDPAKQISEFIGSGPFIFKADEWKPGDKTVYVKNPTTSHAPSPPPAWPAAKSRRWTGSSGWAIPTTRRR